MNRPDLEFISELFPFVGLTEKTLSNALSFCDMQIECFAAGAVIFQEAEYQSKIGFVIDGLCEVVRPRLDDGISLNTLSRKDSFGVVSVFSPNGEFPTRIIAKRASKILFFTRNEMLTLVSSYPEIALNVIRFLTGRISFLNKKIATFSEKSTLQRLASYLLSEYERLGEKIPFSATKVSAKTNIGRASIYRDIAKLEDMGAISVADRKIIIKCPCGLERILK